MKKSITDIICGLLILLFTYAAFSKLLAFGHFRFALSNAPLIGNYSTLFAALIVVVELIIVILLLMPQTNMTGFIAAVSLLVLFTIYLVFMVITDPDLPCSCGGVIQELSWKQHIAFNIFFIGLGITGIYYQRDVFIKKTTNDSFLKQNHNPYCNRQEVS